MCVIVAFLVNNAGVLLDNNKLMDMEESVLDETLNINVKGTLLMSKYVLRQMVKQGSGSIVNVASMLGVLGGENTIAYTASKGAILACTRAMSTEYTSQGIRVNAISPSVTCTGMEEKLFEKIPELEEKLRSLHPAGKFGTVQDVSQAIIYLASDESAFTTGQNLVLDGGRSVCGG